MFEEWAAATNQHFAGADSNQDKLLTRKEFATTRPKAEAKPGCRCQAAKSLSRIHDARSSRARDVMAAFRDFL